MEILELLLIVLVHMKKIKITYSIRQGVKSLSNEKKGDKKMKKIILTIILIAGFIHPPNVFAKTIKLPWSLINVWWDTSTKEGYSLLRWEVFI